MMSPRMFPNFTVFFLCVCEDPGPLAIQELEQQLADLEALDSAVWDSKLVAVSLPPQTNSK